MHNDDVKRLVETYLRRHGDILSLDIETEAGMQKTPTPKVIAYSKETEGHTAAVQGSDVIARFAAALEDRIIGQPQVINAFVNAYRTFLVGMNPPGRPITVMLLAGPTGCGKTVSVQAAAETLYGSRTAFTKIDCAEFQHSHEVAKLTGAPPGYLGHRETEAIFSQTRLERYHTTDAPFNLVLFDEIEKAHPALWDILLGIFDTGTLTLGNNHPTDFTKSMIIMTTNLGAKEMERILNGTGLGFVQPESIKAVSATESAIRGAFRPEFMNRIDTIITLDRLSKPDLERIFHLEMIAVQDRILGAKCPVFILRYTDAARDLLIAKGTDARYGARPLKRTIEKCVVQPIITKLLAKEIDSADTLTVDAENGEITLHLTPRNEQ